MPIPAWLRRLDGWNRYFVETHGVRRSILRFAVGVGLIVLPFVILFGSAVPLIVALAAIALFGFQADIRTTPPRNRPTTERRDE